MENQQPERIIYFKDLVFAILYKWKWIVLAVLVGAIALGGMELLNKKNTVTLNSVSITPENQIKIDQLQTTLEITERNIKSQTAYLDQSVLMTLNPYAAYTAGMYVHVCPASLAEVSGSVQTYDRTYSILSAYLAAMNAPETMAALGQEFGMESIYLRELITLEITSGKYLSITVRGHDLQEAQEIADVLQKLLEVEKDTVSSAIENHSVTVVPFATGPKMDTSLYDTQNSAYQKLTTLKNTKVSTTTELDKLLPTELVPGEAKPLLFAIVGAVLGFCVVAGIACVGHLASGKVYSARTLKDHTGIRILGRINGKKRNFIDSWLRKLEGRSVYQELDAVTANIVNRCTDVKNLLLLGCYDAKILEPLTAELDRTGVQCTVCADPTCSAQAIKALPGCDAAVLVETCARSSYDNVIWSMDTVEEYGKTLIGCVLIDG